MHIDLRPSFNNRRESEISQSLYRLPSLIKTILLLTKNGWFINEIWKKRI